MSWALTLWLIAGMIVCGRWLPASDASAAFAAVMSGDDATQKRTAIRALASGGSDDDILPLLIQAVSDRQTHDVAIESLRARTGLKPPVRRGQSDYPNYPSEDTAAAWSYWLNQRKRVKDQEAKIVDVEKLAKAAAEAAEAAAKKNNEAKTTKDGPVTALVGPDVGKTTDSEKPIMQIPPEPKAAPHLSGDLGNMVRLYFMNSRSLECYVLARRTDAHGKLLSVKIVHADGSGEETLEAHSITRMVEDLSCRRTDHKAMEAHS